MIEAAGLEVPPDADVAALFDVAADAEQAFYAHMGRTFLSSRSLRGMAEVKRMLSLVDETEQNTDKAPAGTVPDHLLAVFVQVMPNDGTGDVAGDIIEGDIDAE